LVTFDARWAWWALATALAIGLIGTSIVVPLGDPSVPSLSDWGAPADDAWASGATTSTFSPPAQTWRHGGFPAWVQTGIRWSIAGHRLAADVDVSDPRLVQRYSRWTL